MFWVYVKDSIKALPWIILLPLASYVLYMFGEGDGWWFLGVDSGMLISMIAGIVSNLLFAMVIPAAGGGPNPDIKKSQFYLGFFVNLGLTLILPIVYYFVFFLDPATAAILVGLHVVFFVGPYLLAALFVTSAYKWDFWFFHRG
jgi:hypothetical protein